jgi:hypothetical protein
MADKHPQRQDVDLQDAENIEIVLVPLDDGAIRHRRVLDRHQVCQGAIGNDKTSHVLGQMSGKSPKLLNEREELLDHQTVDRHSLLGELFSEVAGVVPVRHRSGQHVHLIL